VNTQPAFSSWQIVLAELKEGKVSVGVRFDKADTVHFFLMHKTPKEATQVAINIARGEITLQDIARYDWRAVTLPYKEL
jgi:hypothetical protein